MGEECVNGSSPFFDHRSPQAAEGIVEATPVEMRRSASMLPMIMLYQQAWELAQTTELSLSRLERAAEAAALADAILHLLAEAGDQAGHARWVVRASEARHWCAVVHDALTIREEQES
jgi:hypothetical protein